MGGQKHEKGASPRSAGCKQRVRTLRNTAQRYLAMAKKAWGAGTADPEDVRDYMFELHRPVEVRWMVAEMRANERKPLGA